MANTFLTKLKKEEKLKLVEPSDTIHDSYSEKSANCLQSAKLLLQNNLYENSIGMSYYAMYDLLLALLFRVGIKCENHNGSILLHAAAPLESPSLQLRDESGVGGCMFNNPDTRASRRRARNAAGFSPRMVSGLFLLNMLFGEHTLYGLISDAKKERIDKQYYVSTEKDELTKEIAEELLNGAEDFILKTKVIILNLNNDMIDELRKKFQTMYSR